MHCQLRCFGLASHALWPLIPSAISSTPSTRQANLNAFSQPVATELEITELADREMKSAGGGKALLFEKPTVNGVVSPFPLAINTMGSQKRMAMSMGANSVDEVANELGALMKAKPPTSFSRNHKTARPGALDDLRHAKPKIVRGACKEVVHKLDAPDSPVKSKADSWQPRHS